MQDGLVLGENLQMQGTLSYEGEEIPPVPPQLNATQIRGRASVTAPHEPRQGVKTLPTIPKLQRNI